MSKTTTSTIDITTRTGRRPLHAYLSDDAHREWTAAADTHGLPLAAIIEAMGPRIEQMLAAEPTVIADAIKVSAVRRKRGQR